MYFRTKLHTVQKQIADSHGSQCGFCTPGIVMSMYTLLRNDPCPKMEDVETYFQVQYHLFLLFFSGDTDVPVAIKRSRKPKLTILFNMTLLLQEVERFVSWFPVQIVLTIRPGDSGSGLDRQRR